MENIPLSVISPKSQTAVRVLNDMGVVTLSDILLFTKFYPMIVQQISKVAEFGITSEEYRQILSDIKYFLKENESFSFNKPSHKRGDYVKNLIGNDYNDLRIDSNMYEKLNSLFERGSTNLITGSKSTGKSLFW